MAEERKGVMTPKQEKQLDDICEFDGWMETFDGPAIRIADNQIIERLKNKIPKEYHNDIYGIVDAIFDNLPKKK
jgi:hypothetical protein